MSAGTGLLEALLLGSAFLKRTFDPLRKREVAKYASFNITMNLLDLNLANFPVIVLFFIVYRFSSNLVLEGPGGKQFF